MDLNNLYKKYNYPGAQKLYLIAKKEGLNYTQKQVSDFTKTQQITQLYTKSVKPSGHILAYNPNSILQMDLIDMSNFSKTNKGITFLLFIIDVFTRKAYAYPLKNKTIQEIEEKINQHFKINGYPSYITSDNEKAFVSHKIQQLLKSHGIFHDKVDKGNHKALGVLDRAVLTIKRAIFKHFTEMKTTKYINELDNIINAYNETPHNSILDMTPNEVAKNKANTEAIQIINHRKFREMKTGSGPKFKVGDIVRVEKLKKTFTRGYDRIFSKNTHTIKNINLNIATLSNNKIIPFRRLKLVPLDQPNDMTDDAIKEAVNEKKSDKRRKRDDRDISNILPNRTRGKQPT